VSCDTDSHGQSQDPKGFLKKLHYCYTFVFINFLLPFERVS
jgi:hypothetical protein